MSLLRTSWLALAGALTSAVAIPWWLISPINVATSDIGPPPRPRPIAVTWPQLPASALSGRLFFGQPNRAALPEDDGASDPVSTPPGLPPQPSPAIESMPILVGTIVNRAGAAAAIVRLSNGESRVVTRGNTVDGWRIGHITNGHATLAKAERTERISVATQTTVASANEMREQ